MTRSNKLGGILLAAALALPRAATAADLIDNGGFETGFSGWSRLDLLGSDGTFALQTGVTSPVNALPVPPPPEGTFAAMTDAGGPGSHLLYQDFAVAAPVSAATLSFRLFVNNTGGDFFTPPTLDPFLTTIPATINQQARVDILLPGVVDPFSVATADILMTAFHTAVGDPATSGYTLYSVNVTSLLNAHVGESLRLRFSEVDNLSVFNLGVDDVHITLGAGATVPEPATVLLVAAGVLGLVARRRSHERA